MYTHACNEINMQFRLECSILQNEFLASHAFSQGHELRSILSMQSQHHVTLSLKERRHEHVREPEPHPLKFMGR